MDSAATVIIQEDRSGFWLPSAWVLIAFYVLIELCDAWSFHVGARFGISLAGSPFMMIRPLDVVGAMAPVAIFAAAFVINRPIALALPLIGAAVEIVFDDVTGFDRIWQYATRSWAPSLLVPVIAGILFARMDRSEEGSRAGGSGHYGREAIRLPTGTQAVWTFFALVAVALVPLLFSVNLIASTDWVMIPFSAAGVLVFAALFICAFVISRPTAFVIAIAGSLAVAAVSIAANALANTQDDCPVDPFSSSNCAVQIMVHTAATLLPELLLVVALGLYASRWSRLGQVPTPETDDRGLLAGGEDS